MFVKLFLRFFELILGFRQLIEKRFAIDDFLKFIQIIFFVPVSKDMNIGLVIEQRRKLGWGTYLTSFSLFATFFSNS